MARPGVLGPLETAVMEVMWRAEKATVREVVDILQQRRAVAYTTVMTIMNNLVSKGLLRRAAQGKAYRYTVAMSKKALLHRASREAVSDVLDRFGDLAVAHFVERLAKFNPDDLERLRRLAAQTKKTAQREPRR